jgi:hypothetical protein
MYIRLFRQRRRIVILVLSAMLAGALQFGAGTPPLLCGLVGLTLACLVIMLAPNRRRWIEALGIGLILAVPMALPPIASGMAAIACATLAHLAIHSRWTDRTPLHLALVSHRISRVRASPAQVWAALIPGEGHPDDHWTGTLADYDHDPDDPFTTYLRYRTADGLFDDVTISFLDHGPLTHCRYVIERFEDGFAEAGTMMIDITEPEPGECRIASRLSYDALPPRVALGRWLDDTFGDEWDSFAAMVSARRDWSLHGLRRAKTVSA